jgi:hypothetical protein
MPKIRFVEAAPVPFHTCPKCDFPLNTYFLEMGFAPQRRILVHVACCRCMWSEAWGELKVLPTKGKDDAERITA